MVKVCITIGIKTYEEQNKLDKKPGVYEMSHGDQVKDLLEKAEGLSSNIDNSNIILDAELLDGQVIRIE